MTNRTIADMLHKKPASAGAPEPEPITSASINKSLKEELDETLLENKLERSLARARPAAPTSGIDLKLNLGELISGKERALAESQKAVTESQQRYFDAIAKHAQEAIDRAEAMASVNPTQAFLQALKDTEEIKKLLLPSSATAATITDGKYLVEIEHMKESSNALQRQHEERMEESKKRYENDKAAQERRWVIEDKKWEAERAERERRWVIEDRRWAAEHALAIEEARSSGETKKEAGNALQDLAGSFLAYVSGKGANPGVAVEVDASQAKVAVAAADKNTETTDLAAATIETTYECSECKTPFNFANDATHIKCPHCNTEYDVKP
ncbi:MAG: hypothetical protein Q7R34_12555 [Dehalococcoidia bacterium]|nr:hypothetical protein [Dehalococcoidia bacterium]